MKIITRDVGLLAIGLVIGAIITVLLASTPTRPPTAPTSSIMATGPVLAAASLSLPLSITNIQWQTPPLEIDLPPRFLDSFDPQSPLYPPMSRNVDLIDTRYQPDIKLDDLK